MQLHTGQYSYQCTECRKGFNEKSHYDAHMRGHERIMFHCKYCDKSFTQKESLRKHMSMHSGEYNTNLDVINVKDLMSENSMRIA